MTAKRFTHKEDDWEIFDNGEHLAYAHSDYQAEKICELLNELHEENQALKSSNLEYEDIFGRLEEQNEQLQKSLSASVEKNRKLQTILDKLGYDYVGDLK